MSTVQLLREARRLIERGWCRGRLAKTRHGQAVRPDDEDAYRFCAIGALARLRGMDAGYYLAAALPEDYGGEVMAFNDAQRSKKPILDLYDRAIALAESEARDAAE